MFGILQETIKIFGFAGEAIVFVGLQAYINLMRECATACGLRLKQQSDRDMWWARSFEHVALFFRYLPFSCKFVTTIHNQAEHSMSEGCLLIPDPSLCKLRFGRCHKDKDFSKTEG